jgi:ABC-type sugar transport system substrate-binding protein
VGILMGDLGNPLLVYMSDAAAQRIKELCGPETKITILSCGYDLNTQSNQIENLISAQTDLIILNAADSKSIAPSVRKAKEAGVIVVAMDVSAEGGVDATVMSNNVEAGKQAGQYIVNRLKGKGEVVIINGPPVSSIIGVDGAAEVQTALKDKANLIAASPAQDFPGLGSQSAQVGYEIFNGKRPNNPTILIPVQLLTKANINDYKGPLSAK